MGNSEPMVTQMALTKLYWSQNQHKSHGSWKETYREEEKVLVRGCEKGAIRMRYRHVQRY